MRKFWVLGVLALVGLCLAAPVWAADNDDQKWHVHGDVRVRADYFENYDFLDTRANGTFNDNFGISPFTVRLSVDGQISDSIHGMVELRNDETLGSAPTLSSDPRLFSNSPNAESDVQLYQAFIDLNKVGGSSLSFRIGRQEHTLGTELLMGDNDFYTGQSFDGIRAMWNADKWDLNAFYYKILEQNSNPTFNPGGFAIAPGSSDSNFMGVTFDWKFDASLGQLDVYYLRFQDLSGSFASTPPSTLGAGIDTYGARWGKMVDHQSKDMFDWNIEYAKQSGDYGFNLAPPDSKVDVSGDVTEGWFGFNFHPGTVHHRIHVGFLQSSGDDPTTAKDEGFIPLFGDNHAHNRLGNLDNFGLAGIVTTPGTFSGIQDINVGYDVWFGEGQTQWFMVAYHKLKLDQEDVFSPTVSEDDYGSIWDFSYGYMMNKNLSFEVGASQHAGGDEQDRTIAALGLTSPTVTSSDNAMRLYGQINLRW